MQNMLLLKEIGDMPPRKFLKLHALKLNLSSLGVVPTLAVHIYVAIFVYNICIFSPVLHPGHVFFDSNDLLTNYSCHTKAVELV